MAKVAYICFRRVRLELAGFGYEKNKNLAHLDKDIFWYDCFLRLKDM